MKCPGNQFLIWITHKRSYWIGKSIMTLEGNPPDRTHKRHHIHHMTSLTTESMHSIPTSIFHMHLNPDRQHASSVILCSPRETVCSRTSDLTTVMINRSYRSELYILTLQNSFASLSSSFFFSFASTYFKSGKISHAGYIYLRLACFLNTFLVHSTLYLQTYDPPYSW